MGNNIITFAHNIKPSDRLAYIDKVTVWLTRRLPRDQLHWLRQQCGHLHVKNRCRFNRAYRQRLQLQQPTPEALQSLSTLPHHLNYLEVALDWIFPDEQQRDQAYAFVSRYHVKKWHGQQGIHFIGQDRTRYTGPRRAPNVMVAYKDRHSKVTGEVNCVHCEWRMRGGALRRQIKSLIELNQLDYHQFWQQRLLLYQINSRELGRRYRYYTEGKQRRGEWILFKCKNKFTYDIDRRIGDVIIRQAQSTQNVIDAQPKQMKVRDCLIPIRVDHLIPGKIVEAQEVVDPGTTLLA